MCVCFTSSCVPFICDYLPHPDRVDLCVITPCVFEPLSLSGCPVFLPVQPALVALMFSCVTSMCLSMCSVLCLVLCSLVLLTLATLVSFYFVIFKDNLSAFRS